MREKERERERKRERDDCGEVPIQQFNLKKNIGGVF